MQADKFKKRVIKLARVCTACRKLARITNARQPITIAMRLSQKSAYFVFMGLGSFVKQMIMRLMEKNTDNISALLRILPDWCWMKPKLNMPHTMAIFSVMS